MENKIEYLKIWTHDLPKEVNFVVKLNSDRIQTLSVEFFHLDEMGNSNDELKSYMEKQVSIEWISISDKKFSDIFLLKYVHIDGEISLKNYRQNIWYLLKKSWV
jgi:hypothetical protein